MKIIRSSISLSFSAIQNLRKQITVIEDNLKDHFAPFNILPIPDNVPPEIPRVIAESKGGHAKIQLSAENIIIVVDFDENYNRNWPLCKEYIEGKLVSIYDTFKSHLNQFNAKYIGQTVEIIFDEINEPIDHMKKQFIRLPETFAPCDLECKLTRVEDGRYYVNVHFTNTVDFRGLGAADFSVAGAYESVKTDKQSLLVTIDVNDRYAFNFDKGYKFSDDNVQKVLDISDNVIRKKLGEFIQKGEW